jgi:hypothetical protein
MVESTSVVEPSVPDPAALDAEWRRCRNEAHSLTILELAEISLAVGILVVVALCGIAALTQTGVASGALGLPLGLGLAVTVALSILGFAFRVRMSHEVLSQQIFRLDCARRTAAELASLRSSPHPYRASARSSGSRCMLCVAAAAANITRSERPDPALAPPSTPR